MNIRKLNLFQAALNAAAREIDPRASVKGGRIRSEREAYVYDLMHNGEKVGAIEYERQTVDDALDQLLEMLGGLPGSA